MNAATTKAATLLRSVRWARQLSQRELADVAGVPLSTIERIESGQTPNPGLRTIERILSSTGYQLAIANQHGRLLNLDEERFRHLDRSGRHLPAHLPNRPVTTPVDGDWWGWFRVAWWADDPKVPDRTYSWRRPSRWEDPYYADERWNDAT